MPKYPQHNYAHIDALLVSGIHTDQEIASMTNTSMSSIRQRRRQLLASGKLSSTKSTRVAALRRDPAIAMEARMYTSRYLDIMQKSQQSIAPIVQKLLMQVAQHADQQLMVDDLYKLAQTANILQKTLRDSYSETQQAIMTFCEYELLTPEQSKALFNALETSQAEFQERTKQILNYETGLDEMAIEAETTDD